MTQRHYLNVALILTLAGTLFAGYMTSIKLFTKICAFNEPCPYFLGYPACWYGLAMFGIMFIVTLTAWVRQSEGKGAPYTNLTVSILGILFAGQYAVPEIMSIARGEGTRYALGLPTCVYGLIFYIAIFIVTLVALRSRRTVNS